jgi:hypothetical protein
MNGRMVQEYYFLRDRHNFLSCRHFDCRGEWAFKVRDYPGGLHLCYLWNASKCSPEQKWSSRTLTSLQKPPFYRRRLTRDHIVAEGMKLASVIISHIKSLVNNSSTRRPPTIKFQSQLHISQTQSKSGLLTISLPLR